MSIGQIVQVIGAVVDIEFARDEMPRIYEALVLEQDKENTLAEGYPVNVASFFVFRANFSTRYRLSSLSFVIS